MWNCPRWLCWLLTKHRLTQEWANYMADQSGRRCYCGLISTDYWDSVNKKDERMSPESMRIWATKGSTNER